MNATETKVYKCGVCGSVYYQESLAEICCEARVCECGKHLGNSYYTICDQCRASKESNRISALFEKASTVKWSEAKCDCVYHPSGINDGYMTLDDLDIWLDDLPKDVLENLQKEPWVFATSPYGHGITPNSIMDFVENSIINGEFYEDAVDNMEAMTEAEENALSGWLARCDFTCWKEDCSRKISIEKEISDALASVQEGRE